MVLHEATLVQYSEQSEENWLCQGKLSGDISVVDQHLVGCVPAERVIRVCPGGWGQSTYPNGA